jgi:hypothetical protein
MEARTITLSSPAMLDCPTHPAALSPDELLKQCDIRFLRRSGPGGQHRNKVSTAVALVHRPTGVQAEASERRSQAENRTEAVFRLRVNLALAIRGNCEPGSMPSTLWQSRLGGGRIDVSATHDDFPTLLAEALDVAAACDYDPRAASERLGCTASQLIKLLKKEARAIAMVNGERRQRGLHALR